MLLRPLEGVCLRDVTVVAEEDASDGGQQTGRVVVVFGDDKGAVLIEQERLGNDGAHERTDTVAEEHQLSSNINVNIINNYHC